MTHKLFWQNVYIEETNDKRHILKVYSLFFYAWNHAQNYFQAFIRFETSWYCNLAVYSIQNKFEHFTLVIEGIGKM
jgi:hypothetical protein